MVVSVGACIALHLRLSEVPQPRIRVGVGFNRGLETWALGAFWRVWGFWVPIARL
jgi:hypothetical protein